MFGSNKDTRHYSVRESRQRYKMWKVVLAGNNRSYSDLDLPLYETFDEAMAVADRLNMSKALSEQR